MARQKVERKLDDVDDSVIPEYRMPGRPPRSPKNKVGTPVRALTTIRVSNAIDAVANDHAITRSNMLRLAIYRYLEARGLMDEEMRKDATWDDLRLAGLV